MLSLTPVSAFSDNYIWVLHNQTAAVAIDPGQAAPLQAFLQQHALQLAGVLITHHHYDHLDGVPALAAAQANLRVIGPAQIPLVNEPVAHDSMISILDCAFRVMAVPGHTLDHLAYYSAPWLFCGDTLFGAGCGRLFEGSAAQMLQSLQTLASLPGDTLVCPAHEYTLSNLQFARHVEPFNNDINQRLEQDKTRRNQDSPTLPCQLEREWATNPFLRCKQPTIRHAVEQYTGRLFETEVEIFAALRQWKDGFKGQDV